MNHKKTIAKASSMESTNKESLFDSMLITDFFNKVMKSEDLQLIQKVHKIVGQKVVDCVSHWKHQNHSLFETFLDKGLFPLKDATKQVGDLVVFGEMVGVVRKIEGKLFIVHMTDGHDLPFATEED
jgi:predicted transcriptional regulator YheO